MFLISRILIMSQSGCFKVFKKKINTILIAYYRSISNTKYILMPIISLPQNNGITMRC